MSARRAESRTHRELARAIAASRGQQSRDADTGQYDEQRRACECGSKERAFGAAKVLIERAQHRRGVRPGLGMFWRVFMRMRGESRVEPRLRCFVRHIPRNARNRRQPPGPAIGARFPSGYKRYEKLWTNEPVACRKYEIARQHADDHDSALDEIEPAADRGRIGTQPIAPQSVA